MSGLLIVSNSDSDFAQVLREGFQQVDAISFDDMLNAELDKYDAIALLGGTDRDGISLLPPARKAIDRQLRMGKRVLSEFVRGVAQVSFLDKKNTRFDRPVLVAPHEVTADIDIGTIFDEQSNNRLIVYKATNRTKPILQYVKTPVGFYKVKDVSEIENDLSRYALWQELPNLIVASFRLCNFAKARFAPHRTWALLLSGLVKWMGGDCEPERIMELFEMRYGLSGTHSLADAVSHAAGWFDHAGMFIPLDGAPYAVREGLSSSVSADGSQALATAVRDDCTGEVAYAYFLRWLLYGDENDKRISDGLYRMPIDMQIVDECPHKGMVRGCINGWWNVSYQDDTARGFLLPLMWRAFFTGERGDIPRIKLTLDYLLRSTGTDGLRATRIDFYDQNSEAVEATGLHSVSSGENGVYKKWVWGGGISGATTLTELTKVPANIPSVHYNGYYLAALLLGAKLTGDARYFEVGVKGISSIMAAYPFTAREHSETQELCRLILPLSMLYWVSGDATHREWLYKVTRDLQRFRHPKGGYIEWDTGYTATCAGNRDGESSVLAENGNPVLDLLYSLNWLPHSFALAYYVTGDNWFKQLWEEITEFLASIQIRSENQFIDGVWPRAFDADLREVYGVPNDVGWAPWSVETGWTMGEIMSGMLLGMLESKVKAMF